MPVVRTGVCKLCCETADLQKSHTIADSIFKRIFRNNSGKAITFSRDEDYITYSNDSWWEHQLCSGCEMHLNLEFEQYSMQVLRGSQGIIQKSNSGISFSQIDLNKLNTFFLSIFWRAANSGHPAYKNVVMLDRDNEYLRQSLKNNTPVPVNRFTVTISRLIDRTEQGGFNIDTLKQIIVSPFCRTRETSKNNNVSTCFVFEGFFVEIFVPGLKIKERNKAGVIRKSKRFLKVPYVSIFDINEIVELMVDAYGKHINGKSRIKS
jgi:hypothetical protein